MIQGVKLPELSANDLTDADKSKLLDRYNSYTGAVFSVVSMPFQQIVVQMIPIFFLCFATSTILNENKSAVQKLVLMGVTAVTSIAAAQGINAVNVQFDSPRIDYIIGQNDLVSISTESFSNVVTNITNSASIAGIPSTDTILRSAIRTFASSDDTTCSWADDQWTGSDETPETSVRYGFALNSWLEYLQPMSVESDKSFKFSMSDNFTAESASALMSEWDPDETAKLFSYEFTLILNHYTQDAITPIYVRSQIDSSTAVTEEQICKMQSEVLRKRAFLRSME